MEPLEDGPEKDGWLQLGGAELQKEHVGINHRVAEVTLDVGHSLTLDLETVPHPHTAHDLVERSLKWYRNLLIFFSKSRI